MTKKISRNSVLLSIFIALVLVIGFITFRNFNSGVRFTYYEPSYLPRGVSIKAERISINKYAPTQVEQNFRTEDWVYSIREYKANEAIGTAQQNYDEKSINPTCNTKTSSAMTKYRLCHWIDYGKIDVHEIKFAKGGTFINAQIPTKTNQEVSEEEIDRFVDSFEKKNTIGLPVLRSSGA